MRIVFIIITIIIIIIIITIIIYNDDDDRVYRVLVRMYIRINNIEEALALTKKMEQKVLVSLSSLSSS